MRRSQSPPDELIKHRLDRGGNRQLNYAVHMIALTRLRHDPETATYVARQRERGKTHRDAMRSLKRHLIRRIWRLLTQPNTVHQTVCGPIPLTSETRHDLPTAAQN